MCWMCLICPLDQSPRDPSPKVPSAKDPLPKDPSLACCPTLKLLKVLNVLNVLKFLNVLNLLDMPNDPTLPWWALFFFILLFCLNELLCCFFILHRLGSFQYIVLVMCLIYISQMVHFFIFHCQVARIKDFASLWSLLWLVSLLFLWFLITFSLSSYASVSLALPFCQWTMIRPHLSKILTYFPSIYICVSSLELWFSAPVFKNHATRSFLVTF